MNIISAYKVTFITLLCCLAAIYEPLSAETKLEQMQKQQQQQMQMMNEMMKKQGIDPNQMQQMQGMMQFFMNQGMRMEANKVDTEIAEFDKKMANNGDATIETRGKVYKLKVSKCEVKNRENGLYTIEAQQAPGGEDAKLSIYGDDKSQRSSLQFQYGRKINGANQQDFDFDGKQLRWEGELTGDAGPDMLALKLNCGAETLNLDQPSAAKSSLAKNEANVLTFKLGDETYEFEAGLCSTKEYRTGNLMVLFEATATGSFRGRPAVILLSKSHPVGQTRMFENMSLLLTELTPEQRQLPPGKVKQQLDKVINDYQQKAMLELNKKYDIKSLAALPIDKQMEVMDQMSKESKAISDKAKAMRYPNARGFGAITIKGNEVLFRSARKLASGNSNVPEFKDLPKQSEIWVRCKD